MDWINDLDPHWIWLALGMFLFAAEILVPGTFLMWLAGAALITGALTWLLPIGVPIQIVIFAVLAIAAVFAGKRYIAANPIVDADPKMNRRGMRLAGETAVVVQAIDGGTGRVRHGDSEWLARGVNAEVGDKVRITGSDGAVLLVEAVG